jgi:hypothetical protein
MNIKVNQSKNKFTNREKERILSDYSNTINPNNKFDINAAKVANILTGEKPKNNKESRNLIQTFLKLTRLSHYLHVLMMMKKSSCMQD